MTEVVVICSGRDKPHGRIQWPSLVLGPDGVREVLIRTRPAPWPKGAVIEADGETYAAPSWYVDTAEPHVVNGHGRWKCPKCHIDVRLSRPRLLAKFKEVADTPEKRLDISLLPRE